MKKTVRMILIMVAVLVVLGGGAAALLLIPPDSGEEAESSAVSTARETILEYASGDIDMVEVENSQGAYEIYALRTEAAPESGSEDGEGPAVQYTIADYEKYNVDTGKVTTAVEGLGSVLSNRELGEQEELEKYGLSGERSATLTIKDKSGASTQVILGDTNSSGTAGQYILLNGKVYIVPALSDLFMGAPLECLSTSIYAVEEEMVEAPGEDGETTQTALPDTLYNARISGEHFPQAIELKYVERSTLNGHMMTAPVTAESGTEAFDTLLTALKSLTAKKVVAAGVQESDLAQYGLDKPDAQAEFHLNQSEISIKASKRDSNDQRYVMLEGRDVVYLVDNTMVKAWAEANVMDLRMSYVALVNIADTERLTLTVEGDMVYDFTITQAESGNLSDMTIKNAAGETIDYENYQSFYKELIALGVFSLEEQAYGSEAALKIEYKTDSQTEVVELFPVEGQDRYAAVLNGGFNGLVRKDDVDKLISRAAEVNENKGA